MEKLVKSVAIALNDPQMRRLVRDAITSSPYHEHKVDFDQYIATIGGPLLNRLSEVGAKAPIAVVVDLANIYPLQMYFPIKGQLEAWQGGTDLLVATQASDTSAPVIFNLRGERVTGLGPQEAPTLPTLVLTRREGRFKLAGYPMAFAQADCESNPEACEGGGGGSGGVPAWERVFEFHVDDDFEGIFGGDPEFEITVVPTSAGVYDLPKYRCVGEGFSSSNPRHWDVNDNILWQGIIGTLDFLVQTQSDYLNIVTYLVTENDDDGCQDEFPSVGNPDPFGNDDDEVAIFDFDWNTSARGFIKSPVGHLRALTIGRRYTFDPVP